MPVHDAVVVGGGRAGATAALRLAAGGRHVVLVDAVVVGGGRQGRRPHCGWRRAGGR